MTARTLRAGLPLVLLAPAVFAQLPARSPAPFPLVPAPELGRLVPAPGALESLAASRDAELEVLLPDGARVVLELDRARSTAGGTLTVDGEIAGTLAQLLPRSSSAWIGRVQGLPGSSAQLAFSPLGSRGTISYGGEAWHLIAEPAPDGTWNGARSAWHSESALLRRGQSFEFECGTRTPEDWSPDVTPNQAGQGTLTDGGAEGGTVFDPIYNCRLALETDYAFFQKFGDVIAAADYALLLSDVVSAVYEQEIGAVLDVRNVSIYSSESTDPFSGTSPGALLDEIQSLWVGGLKVKHDLGHVLSGHSGGGVAYVDVLCNGTSGVGASTGIGGNLPLPLAQGPFNWDFIVYSHELGHQFGTSHTHNYCPPLDQCAPSDYFGSCQSSQVCQEGTIMSYCHLCSGGVANMDTTFHPTVETVLRNAVESSCLLPVGQGSGGSTGPPQIAAVLPPVTPAVVVDGPLVVTLEGDNFTGTTAVRVDGVELSTFPPAWFVEDKNTLTLDLPPSSSVGDVTIEVENAFGVTSDTLSVIHNGTPTLELVNSDPLFLVQLVGLEVLIGAAPGDVALLVGSTVYGQSVLPGVIDLEIGADFAVTVFLGSKVVSPTTGSAAWQVPLNGNLPIGTKIWLQGAVLRADNPVLPLEATNAQSGTVLF